MDDQTTVVELPQSMRDNPMRRQLNQGLMVHWINAHLEARASYDVRSSLVLYDADGDFTSALPASIAGLGNFEDILQALFDQTSARFYSKGI